VVQAGKTASVEFKNERATGKTTLVKQDATTKSKEALNPTYPLAGAKYGLFKKDGTLLKEFTLAADLTASVDKLELGSYYWGETLAPTGYTLDKTKHVVELTYKDQVTPVVVKDAA
ncbi:prealbumin-like fold domain-containing protein, partial [Carnobacterium maltaromaticum]